MTVVAVRDFSVIKPSTFKEQEMMDLTGHSDSMTVELTMMNERMYPPYSSILCYGKVLSYRHSC